MFGWDLFVGMCSLEDISEEEKISTLFSRILEIQRKQNSKKSDKTFSINLHGGLIVIYPYLRKIMVYRSEDLPLAKKCQSECLNVYGIHFRLDTEFLSSKNSH